MPEDLQSAATAEVTKRSESLELDVTRYTLALKRARKATEAQKAQQVSYKAQTSALGENLPGWFFAHDRELTDVSTSRTKMPRAQG